MSGELSREEHERLLTSGSDLLKQGGFQGDLRFERLSGGRNNRVYRVTSGDQKVVLKWYFHHSQDARERLNAEYAFCEYAFDCGATCVAKPLGRDDVSQLALYSLLEGRCLAAGQVEPSHVEQALDFLRLLNGARATEVAKRLSVASEACFSLKEHVDCVASRVARLEGIEPRTDHHRAAVKLVERTIAPALVHSASRLEQWASNAEVSMRLALGAEQRCISPSDFGFHNALIGADGQLNFFDFEYAGWDDPAKLLCDFYCQPEVPAPRETWEQFADFAAELAGNTPWERERQTLLFPLYQVKWCCILLNEFVETDSDRRTFAEPQPADLASQVEKAQRLADQLQ